jgi:hypothetical protein
LIENRPRNWALPENVTPDGVDLFLLPLAFEFASFLLPVFEAGLFRIHPLSLPQTRSDWRIAPNRAMLRPMGDMLKLIWWAVIGLFRSRVSLEAEILTLRHQLTVLRRKSPKRLAFSNFDRLVFAGLYWIAPRVANALVILQPETVIR